MNFWKSTKLGSKFAVYLKLKKPRNIGWNLTEYTGTAPWNLQKNELIVVHSSTWWTFFKIWFTKWKYKAVPEIFSVYIWRVCYQVESVLQSSRFAFQKAHLFLNSFAVIRSGYHGTKSKQFCQSFMQGNAFGARCYWNKCLTWRSQNKVQEGHLFWLHSIGTALNPLPLPPYIGFQSLLETRSQ